MTFPWEKVAGLKGKPDAECEMREYYPTLTSPARMRR